MKKKIQCQIEPTPFHTSTIEYEKFTKIFADLLEISEEAAKEKLENTKIIINEKEFRLVGFNGRCQTYTYVLKYVAGKSSAYPFYKVSHSVLQFFE